MLDTSYDAIVVGSGPNGLAAAITLSEANKRVLVVEGSHQPGGGARSAELTLPGFLHDVCSAIHPLGIGSPFFRARDWSRYGLAWKQPEVALAHPLDNGQAAVLFGPSQTASGALLDSVRATAAGLGGDAEAYQKLFGGFEPDTGAMVDQLLKPLRVPKHPLKLARFGSLAVRSAESFCRRYFRGEKARALFAGAAAHSIMPLDAAGTAAFGLMLLLSGHLYGWPCAQGGSQSITDAMVGYLKALGGELELDRPICSLSELPKARAVLFDVSPSALADIAGDVFPPRYASSLRRFPRGPGVFKVDWALSAPIPWTAQVCRRAGTVHVGGSLEEIAASERAMACGELSERPFVLVAQQSLFDRRAPDDKHTGWAYCHVPNGCAADRTAAIEAQIERFAPGFRELILDRHTAGPGALQAYNENLVGGDIGGGRNDLFNVLARPRLQLDPYATKNSELFLCSASTPPGGGVHGMCGHLAAQSVLKRRFS